MRIEITGKLQEELWLYSFVANVLKQVNVKCNEVVVSGKYSDDIRLTVDGEESKYAICIDIDPFETYQDGSEVLKYTVWEKCGDNEDDEEEIYFGLWHTGGEEVKSEDEGHVWFKEDSNIEDSLPTLIRFNDGGMILDNILKEVDLEEYFTEMLPVMQMVDKETEIAVVGLALPSELILGEVYRFTQVEGEDQGLSQRFLIIQETEDILEDVKDAYCYNALVLGDGEKAKCVSRVPVAIVEQMGTCPVGNIKEELDIDLEEIMNIYGLN